jgi:23S rRNA-/tRNA-specific pseudouridylate synthase
MELAAAIFDPPVGPPLTPRSFKPWPESYLEGPIPPHLRGLTTTGLVAFLLKISEAEAETLVAFGALWLDDRPCLDPDQTLALSGHFRFNPPAYGPVRFYEADPARIIYEDDELLVYNKESGRPSQGVPHDAHNNILAAVRRLLAARGDGNSSELRLSHRLDADTSGLILMARTRSAAGALGRAFQEGRVAKRYLALGLGGLPPEKTFRVSAPVAKAGRIYLVRPEGPGLAAVTDFTARKWADFPEAGEGLKKVFFLAEPHTGRTHQIRLHLAWSGWPIYGDRFYGRAEIEAALPAPRLMLASVGLTFIHPGSRRELKLSLI